MGRRALVPMLLVLVLAGTAIGALAVVTAQQAFDDPPTGLENVPRRIGTPLVIEGTPPRMGPLTTPSSETAPASCGAWADPTVAGTAGFEITRLYGEMRFCFLYSDTWVITTLGKAGEDGVRRGGVVGLFQCTGNDTACLDNQSDHPFDGWTIVTPPYSGSVSLLDPVDEQTLRLGVGNEQGGRTFTLDVVTGELIPATQMPGPPGGR